MNSKYFLALMACVSITLISSIFALSSTKQLWTLQEVVNAKDTEIKALRESVKENQELVNRITKSQLSMSEELYKTKQELDRNKGRESVVISKPELVEKMINTSFNEFSEDVSCATGLQSSCQ